MSLLVPAEVHPDVPQQLLEFSLSSEEDFLDFPHVLLVLVKFILQHVDCIDLSFEIDFGCGDFFIYGFKLFNVVDVCLVYFLFLLTGQLKLKLTISCIFLFRLLISWTAVCSFLIEVSAWSTRFFVMSARAACLLIFS